ncbi:MAG: hypothetical protein U9R49_06985 [Bacteroidota bacterium]|nr:hypothetical protein [Bacteroidota bacterium]
MNKKNVVQAIINEIEKDYQEFNIRTSVVDGYEPPARISATGDQHNGDALDMVIELINDNKKQLVFLAEELLVMEVLHENDVKNILDG